MTRRDHSEERTKRREQEINVFTYLTRHNKNLYGECKKRKTMSNALHFFIIIISYQSQIASSSWIKYV